MKLNPFKGTKLADFTPDLIILSLVVVSALTGCSFASIKSPSGEVATAEGFLMSVSGLKYTMDGHGGATFSFDNATGDVQMMNSISSAFQQAVQTGLMFAMTNPAPVHTTNAPAPAK